VLLSYPKRNSSKRDREERDCPRVWAKALASASPDFLSQKMQRGSILVCIKKRTGKGGGDTLRKKACVPPKGKRSSIAFLKRQREMYGKGGAIVRHLLRGKGEGGRTRPRGGQFTLPRDPRCKEGGEKKKRKEEKKKKGSKRTSRRLLRMKKKEAKAALSRRASRRQKGTGFPEKPRWTKVR